MALALGGYLSFVSEGLNSIVVTVQSWISVRFVAVQEFVTLPRDMVSLRQENEQLQDEVARLQAQVVQYEQITTQMESLSKLVDFARSQPDASYKAAQVIGRDPSPFLHYIIIDKGSANGLQRGMPVITAQGLVGRVDAVVAYAARVQLITDPASAVNVRFDKNRREAVLIGSVSGDLTLDLLAQDIPVEPNDVLLTSGLGGGYPPDLIVGQILNIRKRDTDLFQQATVQPIVDFTQLKIVLVITDFRPVDITPLIPEP